MTKLRTISQAAEYFRVRDPEIALTKTAIRRLVVNGTIPTVRAGNKYLLSLENLELYLSSGRVDPQETAGKIRTVEVRAGE